MCELDFDETHKINIKKECHTCFCYCLTLNISFFFSLIFFFNKNLRLRYLQKLTDLIKINI